MREYFITTGRLGVSHWQPDDKPLALALWGDPEVNRYISINSFTEEQVYQRLANEIETQQKYGIQYWPVFLKDTGENIGCCGLRQLEIGPAVIESCDPAIPAPATLGNDGYEIGLHLKPPYWGKGYALETAQAVIAYAFGRLGQTVLYARHHPRNTASEKLIARLGFRHQYNLTYQSFKLKIPVYRYKKDDYLKSQ